VPRSVFIIDDADFMIDMIRMILEDADYRVVGASTDSTVALSQLVAPWFAPGGGRLMIPPQALPCQFWLALPSHSMLHSGQPPFNISFFGSSAFHHGHSFHPQLPHACA